MSQSPGSSQTHRKSRKGCRRCRDRRVKCDEKAPCRNCVRRNEECDLELKQDIQQFLTVQAQVQAPIESMEWNLEIYLMHNYTLATSTTLMHHEYSSLVFQKWIPEAAMHIPHLTRGVLAISAFHLAHEKADKSLWLKLAVKNQTIASVALRQALGTLNDETGPGMFILSLLLAMTSFAATTWLEDPSIHDFVESFMLMRGPTDISMSANLDPTLIGQQFWPLTVGFSVIDQCLEDKLPSSIEAQTTRLKRMIEMADIDSLDQTALLEALERLRMLYKEVRYTKATANSNAAFVWKWAGLAEIHYVTLLRSLEPHALVIYAHFSICNDIFRGNWFFQDWAGKSVDVISAHLDPPWREMLEWPRLQVLANLEDFRK